MSAAVWHVRKTRGLVKTPVSAVRVNKQKRRRPYLASARAGALGTLANMFPERKKTKMVFEYGGGLSTGTTQDNWGTSVQFYLNSIFTPKVSIPAFRAQGYDQISGIYRSYKVSSARITLTYDNPTQDGLFVGYRLLPTGETDSLTGEALGTSSMKRFTWSSPINNTGKQYVTKSLTAGIAKVEGLTSSQFRNDIDKYSSAITTSPTNLPIIEVAVINTQDTTNVSLMFKIRIVYSVELYNRKTFASSVI